MGLAGANSTNLLWALCTDFELKLCWWFIEKKNKMNKSEGLLHFYKVLPKLKSWLKKLKKFAYYTKQIIDELMRYSNYVRNERTRSSHATRSPRNGLSKLTWKFLKTWKLTDWPTDTYWVTDKLTDRLSVARW